MFNQYQQIALSHGLAQNNTARLYFDTFVNDMRNAGMAINETRVAEMKQDLSPFFHFDGMLKFYVADGDWIFQPPQGLARSYISEISTYSPLIPVDEGLFKIYNKFKVCLMFPAPSRIIKSYQWPAATDVLGTASIPLPAGRWYHTYKLKEGSGYKKHPVTRSYADFSLFAKGYQNHIEEVRRMAEKVSAQLIKNKALVIKKNRANGIINDSITSNIK